MIFVRAAPGSSTLTNRLYKVLEDERNLLVRQFKKNGIQFIVGNARFENSHMVIVIDSEFRLNHQIKAEIFMIASGSQLRNPIGVPFSMYICTKYESAIDQNGKSDLKKGIEIHILQPFSQTHI